MTNDTLLISEATTIFLLCLFFQQVSNCSVIKERSQLMLEVNLFSNALMTQGIFCTAKSTGAEGTPEALVRSWQTQNVFRTHTGPRWSTSEEQGCSWKSQISVLMMLEGTGLELTKYIVTSWLQSKWLSQKVRIRDALHLRKESVKISVAFMCCIVVKFSGLTFLIFCASSCV